jgi:hypothetical protein
MPVYFDAVSRALCDGDFIKLKPLFRAGRVVAYSGAQPNSADQIPDTHRSVAAGEYVGGRASCPVFAAGQVTWCRFYGGFGHIDIGVPTVSNLNPGDILNLTVTLFD